ncbi:uncharacterized protein LOC143428039 [Xylocopa sonorina]|uniref:uncharacterized protein LOC143428039 n=1 Tax=Xylocopa sonorina TaxID=1818115 RepID=UPI00403AB83A
MFSLDAYKICPYDKTHRIRESKFIYHTVRCRKNYPVKKEQFSFNAFPVIDQASIKSQETCTTDETIKNEQHDLKPSRKLGTVPLETVNSLCVSIMKDWKEENVPTYDPWKNTENRNIIRCLIGATKAEKVKFKLAERQRILKLKNKHLLSANSRRKFKRKCKLKMSRNIMYLTQDLRRLNLEDFDTLLQSIDIKRLCIGDDKENKKVSKQIHVAEVVDKTLVEKFTDLMLYQLKI